jgi:hypothetical protein
MPKLGFQRAGILAEMRAGRSHAAHQSAKPWRG